MKVSALAAPLLAFVAAIGSIVIAVRLVLRTPGIPYNVRELFLDHASLSALVFFALAMVWIGAGAMLLAHVLRRSRRVYLAMPLAVVVISLVSKMLLSRSVTYESIDDIIGSNNLFGLVTRGNAWGGFWNHAFAMIGPATVDFIERRVRYTALYSIPLLGLALTFTAAARSSPGTRRLNALDRFLLFICAAGWFWLARTVVVTWAATDNLTELIARRPAFGVPGEWYLFALPVLIGISVSLLLRASAGPAWWPVAIAVVIVTIPIGWALLNLGLEGHVEKYGAVFSGTQFLLGPDRRHALPAWTLFARWAVLQAAAVAVTFIGAWIAQRGLLATGGAATSKEQRAGGGPS
jgi:hypothetical protein